MANTSPAVTIGKGTLVGAGVDLSNVRVLIRNGYAVAYTRGPRPEKVWEAQTTGTMISGPGRWRITLTNGLTLEATKQDCNCRS